MYVSVSGVEHVHAEGEAAHAEACVRVWGCARIHVCVGAGAHGCVRDRVFAGVYAHMGIGAELEYCNI